MLHYRLCRNRREVIEKGKLEARIRKEFNFETDMRRKRQIRKLAEEELQQYEHFSAGKFPFTASKPITRLTRVKHLNFT